jgi:hypothetical protein
MDELEKPAERRDCIDPYLAGLKNGAPTETDD